MCVNVLHDKRSDCLSISFLIKLGDYLSIIEKCYSDRGGIEGQREPLKTKTGITIRKRMVEDVKKGAVLPAIVIGTVAVDNTFETTTQSNVEEIIDALKTLDLSIIDGMQRTTALKTAVDEQPELSESLIRVEMWIAKSVNKLIYRMLVLNTGQVPWDMKRQLLTVYSSVAKEIQDKVKGIELLDLTQARRRTAPGQFQGNLIVEAFLVFSSGKTNLDLKDQVSQDFARMDVTDSTSDDSFLSNFILVLGELVMLDKAFSKINDSDIETLWKIKTGKDIFTSNPAVIGFFGAASIFLYGEPGFRTNKEVEENLQKLKQSVNFFIEKINLAQKGEDILGLMALNEKLSIKSSKVGEFERSLYLKAFLSLFKNGQRVDSLEQCWVSL